MKLQFSKMQGLGNDFVVFDAVTQNVNLSPAQIRRIADRHFGMGCDQLLLVEKSTLPDTDFRYRIFNADGGEVEQCGNGARCFVKFVYERGLTDKQQIRVQTAAGIITPRLEQNGLVTVDMGAPRFDPTAIPFIAEKLASTYTLEVGGESLEISVLSMGNPHAVQIVKDIQSAPVAILGPQVESHPRFPQRVNAGFMEIVDEHHICLRVYERGSGETLACGTGACAAAVAGIRLGLLATPVKVTTRGGELQIHWSGNDSPVLMTGPAETVFEGVIDLDKLDRTSPVS
ncbi:MAG TPA: diaminopimelate epimerase [Methylophilaceae bacterium]|nr:diaminopimelate epimerase [Methylophilaceae bacterium]